MSTLAPLLNLPSERSPTTPETIAAISALQTYLTQLRARLSTWVDADAKELLSGALRGYAQAVCSATRVGWDAGETEGGQRLRRSVSISLTGLVALYYTLAEHPDAVYFDEVQMAETRKILLASIFPASTDSPHGHIVPVFERARTILTFLQATLRPLAHSKVVSRLSPVPAVTITDADAQEVMSILQGLADDVERGGELSGPVKSKTKAQKEQDKRRPMRIGMDARILRCDIAMSMANRDIKTIKARAKLAVSSDEEEDVDSRAVVDEEVIKWERIAEQALIQVMELSKDLVENKRGGVLSDAVTRTDWLGDEETLSIPASPAKSAKLAEDKDRAESDDETEDETDEEDDDNDSDEVDTHPCPLRSVFRLHDRYEEQRLAVWLSLPAATRPGMGTYMRGDDGAVGEVWDDLGLWLQRSYDR